MRCVNCKTEIGNPKKHKIIDCRCGSKLMLIEINKVKQLVDLSKTHISEKCQRNRSK